MNNKIKTMMEIYGTKSLDWMGDEITNPDKLTIHHIIKKQNGGPDVLSNYALLTIKSHELLNFLEIHDNYNYSRLNELFLELNISQMPPTLEYYNQVRQIVKEANKKIKDNRRGYSRKKK